MPGHPLMLSQRPVVRYVATSASDRGPRLGLRSRPSLVPSPAQPTLLAEPFAVRGASMRRPNAVRPVGIAGPRRASMRWIGTAAMRAEHRARAAATPWRG